MDDLTLGKMLAEAHRGQVDYCVQGRASVSQLSSSVVFDRTGKPVGERNVDQSIVSVSRETRTVLTASFLKTPKLRKWSIGQGNLWERNSSNAQTRTLLEVQRKTTIAENREKSVITNSKQLTPKKSADSRKDNYGSRNWNS